MNGTAHYTGDVTDPSPIQKEADSHVNGTNAMSSFSKQHPEGSEMGNWEAYGTQPSNCHILLKRPCGIIKVEQQITGVRREELPDFDLDRL